MRFVIMREIRGCQQIVYLLGQRTPGLLRGISVVVWL